MCVFVRKIETKYRCEGEEGRENVRVKSEIEITIRILSDTNSIG